MTRGRLVWSPEAETDLADIWDYYAGVAGRRTADNMIRAIGETVRLIEDHPYGGRHAMKSAPDCGRSRRLRT